MRQVIGAAAIHLRKVSTEHPELVTKYVKVEVYEAIGQHMINCTVAKVVAKWGKIEKKKQNPHKTPAVRGSQCH